MEESKDAKKPTADIRHPETWQETPPKKRVSLRLRLVLAWRSFRIRLAYAILPRDVTLTVDGSFYWDRVIGERAGGWERMQKIAGVDKPARPFFVDKVGVIDTKSPKPPVVE